MATATCCTVVNLARRRRTLGVINENFRCRRWTYVDNACDDRFLALSVHLNEKKQHDVREAARRAGPSAAADTCTKFWRIVTLVTGRQVVDHWREW